MHILKSFLLTSVVLLFACGGSGASKSENTSSSDCNSDCTYEVKNHINSQNGKEVNYISKFGKNKYSVSIIDITDSGLAYGGSYSATIKTSCDCDIVSVSISR